MELLFTNTGNGEHVFTCIRKDGSVTWKKGSVFFMYHDLCHFAVETIIPLKHAFFGLVAAGADISEFDLPREQRTVAISEEAVFSEHLVNLFVTDHTQGIIENIPGIMEAIYSEQGGSVNLALLTGQKIETIRNKINELVTQWKSVHEKKSLQLIFED